MAAGSAGGPAAHTTSRRTPSGSQCSRSAGTSSPCAERPRGQRNSTDGHDGRERVRGPEEHPRQPATRLLERAELPIAPHEAEIDAGPCEDERDPGHPQREETSDRETACRETAQEPHRRSAYTTRRAAGSSGSQRTGTTRARIGPPRGQRLTTCSSVACRANVGPRGSEWSKWVGRRRRDHGGRRHRVGPRDSECSEGLIPGGVPRSPLDWDHDWRQGWHQGSMK